MPPVQVAVHPVTAKFFWTTPQMNSWYLLAIALLAASFLAFKMRSKEGYEKRPLGSYLDVDELPN